MNTVSNSFVNDFIFSVKERYAEMNLEYYLRITIRLTPYQAKRITRIEIDAACEMG